MNNDGKYIRTDDANWNPNTDPVFNSQEWSQAEIRRQPVDRSNQTRADTVNPE